MLIRNTNKFLEGNFFALQNVHSSFRKSNSNNFSYSLSKHRNKIDKRIVTVFHKSCFLDQDLCFSRIYSENQ